MSYSILRILSQEADFGRHKIQQQHNELQNQNVVQQQSLLQTNQILDAAQIPQQDKYAIGTYADSFPAHLKAQIESIFQDAYELNEEQYSQCSLQKDIQQFGMIQQQLLQPIKQQQDQQFYKQFVQIFQQAAQNQILQYKTPIEFIQASLLQLLSNNQQYLYLQLIIDYYLNYQITKITGIQYLVNLFKQQSIKQLLSQQNPLADSTNLISTRIGFQNQQKRSKFEIPFYQFLRGEIIQNDNNFSVLEQNIVICLNEMSQNQYVLSQKTFEYLQQLQQQNPQNMTQSQSQFSAEDDYYYKLISSFLHLENFSATIVDKYTINTPFLIQTFLDLVKQQNQKLFAVQTQQLSKSKFQSANSQLKITATNITLFVLALSGNFKEMFEQMQCYGLFFEIFLLGFFLQSEIVQNNYVVQQIDQVEINLLKDVVENNLHFSIGQSLVIVNCFCQAIRALQSSILEMEYTNAFHFHDPRFGVVEDVIASYVSYLRYESDSAQNLHRQTQNLSVSQKYLFALFLMVHGSYKNAFQLLCSLNQLINEQIFIKNQFNAGIQFSQQQLVLIQINVYINDYLQTAAERCILDLLFQPVDIQQFRDQLQFQNKQYQQRQDIQNQQNIISNQLKIDNTQYQQLCQQFNLQLVQLIISYHSSKSQSELSKQLGALMNIVNQLTTSHLQISDIYISSGLNQLIKFLLLCCIRSHQFQQDMKLFVGQFQQLINEENKLLLLQLG